MKKRTNINKAAALIAAVMMIAGSSCGKMYDAASGGSSERSKSFTADVCTAEACYDGYDMYSANGTEEYALNEENSFVKTLEHPLSTFSTDVDTASFTNVRRMIDIGQDIPADAVRTEEFINFFKYSYEAPKPGSDEKVSITTELSDCPWNSSAKLLLVGLQAQEIETKDIDSNIVFLIDVSGSMYSDDKLPLVQKAFSMLSENLGQNDRISIVTYAGNDRVVLEGENGSDHDRINSALDSLRAGGGTAGAAGINTAYDIAEKYFIEGGNNRVILATDGDLNIGISSVDALTALIEEKRDKGIFLSVLGFGTGNYKDNRLEALADNGNGNYAYIDSLDEARRVLVTEMNGTLFTVAKDAKVQVEFDPEQVGSYRLVGYENRLLADKDFEDDTKDAGDIGAGQQVTALYEIIPAGAETEDEQRPNANGVKEEKEDKTGKEQIAAALSAEKLLTVSVRYKDRDSSESKLIETSVEGSSYVAAESASDSMKLACAAAMFAKELRGSDIEAGTEQIRKYAEGLSVDSAELISMLDKYEQRAERTIPAE